MKRPITLLAVLIALLAVAGVVSAGRPPLGPFSTTGYTTGFYGAPLPGLYVKYFITAEGTVEGTTDGSFPNGSFSFDEWVLAQLDPINSTPDQPVAIQAANFGNMRLNTDGGEGQVRFSGPVTNENVVGSFTLADGRGDFKGLKSQGTYSGNADVGLGFTVDYTPCGGKDGGACPVKHCAVFGEDLHAKNKRAEWKLSNMGEEARQIKSIVVFWPEDNGRLKSVKLEGKTIFDGDVPGMTDPYLQAPGLFTTIDDTVAPGWTGKDTDRQIEAGKKRELRFEFEKGYKATTPVDYSVLVAFETGTDEQACLVPWVALNPPPP